MSQIQNYRRVCTVLASCFCSEQQISHIKEHFRDDINSNRKFDDIKSLAYLIRVLEKRDCIEADNTDALLFIAESLGKNDLITLINNGHRQNIDPPSSPSQGVRVLPELSPDPLERVYSLICSEIGQKWKDFARALQIREGFIDELEEKHKKISDRVREIILYHKERVGEHYWKQELFNALEQARRKDLSQQVQDILSRHGLM